jgi:hypothetical protein
MIPEPEDFLRSNYRYFQEWQHWYDKAVKQHRAATLLFRDGLPELRRYEKARRVALKELESRPVAQVKYAHPDMLIAFSLFGSALESAFKGIMVSNKPSLIGKDKLSKDLKDHRLLVLANKAGVKLSERERHLLDWLTEVLIWKARYSVPTDIRYGDKFFHHLDNIVLGDAKICRRMLDEVFARAKKAMPRRIKRVRYGALVGLDEEP